MQIAAGLDEIKTGVDRNQGVLTISMGDLRDAYGAGRLGVHVRRGISTELQKRGLGHYPAELPDYQEELVRLYTLGSPIARLIEAVLYINKDNDERLRQATGNKASEVLRRVRELVSE